MAPTSSTLVNGMRFSNPFVLAEGASESPSATEIGAEGEAIIVP